MEPVPSVDNNLLQSLIRIMNVLLKPFIQDEDVSEEDAIPESEFEKLYAHVEAVFLFSLVWSVGATVNAAGRHKFDCFVRLSMQNLNLKRKKFWK